MIAMPLVVTRWLMAFQNVTVLAAYPRGIGLGDAWLKYMAPVAYPQSAAGGPYALEITIKARRTRL
jgi:hypothetical protein